jgi:Histidine kinase-, DNA gyrase B-, and HSP90-like ATPase
MESVLPAQNFKILTPDASHLVESLRDIGYTLETAIADIVDNSISANASNVNIYFDNTDDNVKIAILDDGHGMNDDALLLAMKIGSKNPLELRSNKDLGRFGLGLKTASFSQCRKLSVITRQLGVTCGARWDLDHIAKAGDWSLEILSENEIKGLYKSELLGESGVIIIWENADRITDKTASSEKEDYVYKRIDDVRRHLELVFHRYLEGERGVVKKVNIFINGAKLEAFDPFNKKNLATQALEKEIIALGDRKIHIQPYILPHHSKMSKKEYDYYAGEGGYLKNQGFYVYRNARLLIHGTWFRIIPQKDLYKLARVQIDVPNDLDHLWKLDVKKSSASPPEIIRERLRNIIDRIVKRSFRVYEGRGHNHKKLLHPFWQKNVAHGKISYEINIEHPFISDFENSLQDDKKREFHDLLKYLANFFPVETLFSDYGSSPEGFQADVHDDQLETLALDKISRFRSEFSQEDLVSYFKHTEPTNKYSQSWEEFVEKHYAR